MLTIKENLRYEGREHLSLFAESGSRAKHSLSPSYLARYSGACGSTFRLFGPASLLAWRYRATFRCLLCCLQRHNGLLRLHP
ncbi:hypothetical protein TgHK011_003943 [Trichoderma gracile]|nr:hypothetical protein TgHK011_003943 [Trichoderma gracile]